MDISRYSLLTFQTKKSHDGSSVGFPSASPKTGAIMKLDAKTIAGLMLPDDKVDRIFFDEELPGFGYRLRKCGNRLQRSWVAQYRAHGRTRRSTVGQAGKLTPGQARDAARKLLATVELGGDPQGDKAAKRQQEARTLRSVVALYLDEKKPVLRPSSFRVTQLYLTGDYFRPLHHVGVSAITHPDVAARISAIKHNSGSVTARQARAALNGLYKWAMGEGLLGPFPANPVVGTHKSADPQPRDRVLSDAELAGVCNACQDDEFGCIVRLLILLGNRRAEVGGMCWSELDLDAGTWCCRQRVARTSVHTGSFCQRQHWQSSKRCRGEATGTNCSAIALTPDLRTLAAANRSLICVWGQP